MVLHEFEIRIAEIYVPLKLRKPLDEDKVLALAESIQAEGQKIPIQVREDNTRYVLVSGLHRVEALKLLGRERVTAHVVHARLV
ncbi:MAG: ParB N-terminal domain-containing protein [Rhodospirillaceae bacterium]|nr:ParB N-terminal domain-containing protein [Rhodospirillaceae bacterium]